MRFCPQCSLILESVVWNDLQIHVCRSCGGCWFPADSFARIIQQDPLKLVELEALFPGISSAGMFEGLPKPCPDCRTVMLDRAAIEEVEGADPRTCPQCSGKWLEAREKGLRLTSPPPLPETTQQPAATENMFQHEAQELPLSADSQDSLVSHESTAPPDSLKLVESAQPVPQAETNSAPAIQAKRKITPPFRASESMPDPRPRANRGAPLVSDTDSDEPVQPAPPFYQPQRWCPQCRRGFGGDQTSCPDCAIGLAESSYRVRCLRCNSENTISADRCWKCHASLHPDELPSKALNVPTDEELLRWRAGNLHQPPKAGSCGTTILVLALVIAALATILH